MKFSNRFNKSFIATNIKFLKIVLLWPPEKNKAARILYITIFLLSYFIMCILTILCELIGLFNGELNYNKTIKTLSIFLLHIIHTFKVVSWFRDNAKLKLCIAKLYRQSFNFEHYHDINFDFNKIHKDSLYFYDTRFEASEEIASINSDVLEEFWMKNLLQQKYKYMKNKEIKGMSVKDYQKKIVEETNIHSTILIISIYTFAIIALFFIYCDCFYETINGYFSMDSHIANAELPESYYMPFDTANIKGYSFICIHQTAVALYVATQYLGIDFFLWSMLIRMDGQLRVIQYALCTIDTEEDTKYICKMDVQFSKCMQEINELIDLLDLLKNIYSIPLLLKYLFVIIVSCCVLYSMTQENNLILAIGMLGFAVCALTNSFVNIFYITLITHQFGNLPHAIYGINWPGTNIRFQKEMIFAMARLQSRIGIDMGGMIPVNLQVFVKILQTTYSFFTLIQTTKNDKVI